jgi:hypothetical protein
VEEELSARERENEIGLWSAKSVDLMRGYQDKVGVRWDEVHGIRPGLKYLLGVFVVYVSQLFAAQRKILSIL